MSLNFGGLTENSKSTVLIDALSAYIAGRVPFIYRCALFTFGLKHGSIVRLDGINRLRRLNCTEKNVYTGSPQLLRKIPAPSLYFVLEAAL